MRDWAVKLGVVMVALLAPAKAMMGTTLLLVVADMITGVWAAKKEGQAISSKKLKNSVLKVVVYELAIALAYLGQTHLTGDALPMASIVASFIGLTETVSVLENLNRISGGTLLTGLIKVLDSKKQPPV